MSGRCVYLTPLETWASYPGTIGNVLNQQQCEAANRCSSGGICVQWEATAHPPPPFTDISLSLNFPTVAVGGSGGNSVTPAICNPDELLVGVTVRSGNAIDGIKSVYCNTTQNILNGAPPREIVVNWGSQTGGNANTFFCPTGAALTRYEAGGGPLQNLRFQCQNILNDSASDKSPLFGSGTAEELRTCDAQSFLGGLAGNAGNLMDSLKGQCRNVSMLQKAFTDPATQLNCCSQVGDPLQCATLYPGSTYCETKTKPLTCSQRAFFSSTGCKQLLGKYDKRVASQTDQDLVEKVCADIKKDANATQAEKDWCSCVNADIPAYIDPTLRGVFQCVDSTCMTKGLKPFGFTCPNTYTICTQKDFQTALQKSEIGKMYVQNNCGQINAPGTTGSGSTGGTTTPPPPTGTTGSGSTGSTGSGTTNPPSGSGSVTDQTNYTRIALYILLGMLLIGGLIIVAVKMSRK